MDEKRIGEIVREVYADAKKNCVSEAKSALAAYVEEEIFKKHKRSISCRTIERTFDKYIDRKKNGSPIAENVDLLCKFLGYKNYSDYVRNRRKKNWILAITVSIAFGTILTIIWVVINQPDTYVDNDSSPQNKLKNNPSNLNTDMKLVNSNNCMTWVSSSYVIVSCNEAPLSEYGTDVKPLDQMEMRNMKKVEVNAAYSFFAEDGKPLVWYYKNKGDEYEYFTAPGYHPVNGETLRKITEGIIEKYVPTHIDRKDSFLK